MSKTMRERIAAAIAKRCGDEPDEIMTYPTEVRGEYREAPVLSEYLEFADDVLAAMREPTEAMVRAMAEWRGTELMDNAAEDEVRQELTGYWRVAADAARQEDQS
jgi:hypothetical protein